MYNPVVLKLESVSALKWSQPVQHKQRYVGRWVHNTDPARAVMSMEVCCADDQSAWEAIVRVNNVVLSGVSATADRPEEAVVALAVNVQRLVAQLLQLTTLS